MREIELLALARVICRLHHTLASGVPLRAQINPHVDKCLFLDVGLVSYMTGIDWSALGRRDDQGRSQHNRYLVGHDVRSGLRHALLS